jgi:arsenate reductase
VLYIRQLEYVSSLPGRTRGVLMVTVLFACVHNAGRSQMAEALFNLHADRRKARAISAGTNPVARVHPVVVDAMREHGVDLTAQVPQKLTESLASQVQWLITMGCGDECPVVPGIHRDDWPIPDPKDQPGEVVRAIREEIDERVRALIETHGWGPQDRSVEDIQNRR